MHVRPEETMDVTHAQEGISLLLFPATSHVITVQPHPTKFQPRVHNAMQAHMHQRLGERHTVLQYVISVVEEIMPSMMEALFAIKLLLENIHPTLECQCIRIARWGHMVLELGCLFVSTALPVRLMLLLEVYQI